MHIVVAVHYSSLLVSSSADWAGLIGASLAVIGVVPLDADKGALCLTMSAPDGLELVDPAGCALLAVAMVPTGVKLLGG